MAEIANSQHKYSIYTGPHFLCSYCQTLFISEEFLNKHQKKCIHRKLHLILKIKFQMRRNTSADDNLKNKTEDYFCEECLSGFLTLSDFERHKQEGHSEEILLTTHQSDRKCTVEAKSEPLIAMTTPQKEKASKVTPKRSLRLNDQEKLKSKQSLGTHSKSKPINKSNKKFSSKNKPIKHSTDKPLTCHHCDMRFSHKSILKRHLFVHTGEKPFDCVLCEMRFSDKGTLKRHLLIHTGEKSFVCDHCDKRFLQNSDLKRHSFVHTGEKPFVCDQCDKSFSQKGNLKQHLKIHHKDN